MSISKDLIALVVALALVGASASIARADGSSVYQERCASCHGEDGSGQTPIGRALGIRSFEGLSFTVEGVGKLLRESQSHASIDGSAIEADLEALVAAMNALAAPAE